MAVVLGSVALVIDVTSPRIAVPERKHRPLAAADAVLSLSRKDPHANAYAASRGSPKGFESDGQSRNNHKAAARGKANSKPDAVDFGSDSGDDESNGNGFKVEDGGEEEESDRERQMRNRLKEFEDMRELEKMAEELQSKVEESGGEGKEETEEQKKMRVKKELEKVAKEQAERRAMANLMFELGQKAYEKGTYGRAIEFLEGALTIIPEWTLFGGEVGV